MENISQQSGIMEFSMKLVYPHKQVIDFAWNERLERLVIERRELDNAMSWLSTLGGAFSALGEEFKHCAEIAGRISVQQFSIALRLGDPVTVARCKLYFALSLVQTGRLGPASRIVEQQYHLALSAPVLDTRLISICLGIWAKLKYEYHKRRTERKKGRTRPLQANFASTIRTDVVKSFQPAPGNTQISIKHTASNILPSQSSF